MKNTPRFLKLDKNYVVEDKTKHTYWQDKVQFLKIFLTKFESIITVIIPAIQISINVKTF